MAATGRDSIVASPQCDGVGWCTTFTRHDNSHRVLITRKSGCEIRIVRPRDGGSWQQLPLIITSWWGHDDATMRPRWGPDEAMMRPWWCQNGSESMDIGPIGQLGTVAVLRGRSITDIIRFLSLLATFCNSNSNNSNNNRRRRGRRRGKMSQCCCCGSCCCYCCCFRDEGKEAVLPVCAAWGATSARSPQGERGQAEISHLTRPGRSTPLPLTFADWNQAEIVELNVHPGRWKHWWLHPLNAWPLTTSSVSSSNCQIGARLICNNLLNPTCASSRPSHSPQLTLN